MPTKHRVKAYVPESYYHIYNRGVNKRRIFIDDQDFIVFLGLLKRYLSKENDTDRYNRHYENLSDKVELLAYCLMTNHFHLLVYQQDPLGMTSLIRRVLTAYGMYFNKKYKRVGPLFQDVYKASQVSSDEYLQHISRYIHLNPKDWRRWDYSSIGYYDGSKETDWINTARISGLFDNRNDYMKFVSDYEDYKKTLDEIKYELADS